MILRNAKPEDAAAMAEVLNAVIALGGTTAHQAPKSAEQVQREYIDGPDVLSSVVALDEGRVIGWQSVGWWQGEAHIGSFVQPGMQAKGAGTAMFALTCDLLRNLGVKAIHASIRADNVPGLAFYGRAGFVDVDSDPEFALEGGQVVGRVLRRFDL